MKTNWGAGTPNAELWCRRMDYAEGLPMWYKSPLNPHPKSEFVSGADMFYLRWIEGSRYGIP